MTESILIIDDDQAMLDFLRQCLSPEGFTILTTPSSQNGINQAILHQPDLILVDLLMPVRDGLTVCQVLRANPRTRHIPIIMITGILSPSQPEEARTFGADDFVSKPVDLIDLLIRIRALLTCRTIEDPEERFTRYTEITRRAASQQRMAGAEHAISTT